MLDESQDETIREEDVTCPNSKCSYKFSDSWEFGETYRDEESDEDECPKCGSHFVWTRHIDVSYSTKLIKKEDEPNDPGEPN